MIIGIAISNKKYKNQGNSTFIATKIQIITIPRVIQRNDFMFKPIIKYFGFKYGTDPRNKVKEKKEDTVLIIIFIL